MTQAYLKFPGWRVRLIAVVAIGLIAAVLSVPRVQARVSHPAAAPALDVQPFPGTPAASPGTEISFPTLAPSQIKSVIVTGSRTGLHRGFIAALPGGQGSAFTPRHPFAAGERVSVHATLRSGSAGNATGAPGATRISFAFGIGVQGRWPAGGSTAAHAAQDSNGLTHTFNSARTLHPPIVTVSGKDPDPGYGDIFGDPENSIQAGPLILDPRGNLIYFQPTVHSAAFNVAVQSYKRQPVLTYFQGYVPGAIGVGVGRDVILNEQYHRVAFVYAGHGYSADLHEFQITPQGDAYITAYNPIKADLRTIGGPRNGTMLDAIIQKINIATGKVLWEWHAYGHIHLAETYAGRPSSGQPWDPFHINSLQLLPNGNVLVSARSTWSVFEINPRTGRIPLMLGGKHSSFYIGPGANFEWQHHAHIWSDGELTVFDNASDGPTNNERQSRALRLRVHYKSRWVSLIRAYTNNPSAVASSQGSVQPLPDGNTFVGWGAAPYMSEFGRTGRQVFRVSFHYPIQSYRGFRFQWTGQPTTPPSLAVRRSSKGTFAFASWNGATTVASWRVLAGPSASSLSTVGEHKKTSFETITWVPNTEPYFEVQALDASGNVLGTSGVVPR